MKNPVNIGVIIFSIVFVALVVWLGLNATTRFEISLSTVLLTLLSIVATWVVAHVYAKYQRRNEIEELNNIHEKSLRTYALKAAEKVTNLSRELDRLSDYLSQYIEGEDEDDLEIVLRVRDERVLGAVHIVRMLRSVNDGALSDWEGVIGEELSQKRDEEEAKEEEREQQAKEIIDAVEQLFEKYNLIEQPDTIDRDRLAAEYAMVRSEYKRVLENVSALYDHRQIWRRVPLKSSVLPCDTCGGEIKVRYNRKGKVRTGGVKCPTCDARFVSRPDESGEPILEHRKDVPETISCPSCEAINEVLLDNVPGGFVVQECEECDVTLRVTRSPSGITVKASLQRKKETLDPSFVDKVKIALPPQPWPQGIHHVIGKQLGTTGSRVQKAIRELIKSGVFKHQIDGVVIENSPAEPEAPADKV